MSDYRKGAERGVRRVTPPLKAVLRDGVIERLSHKAVLALDDERDALFAALHEAGDSLGSIGKAFGYSRKTVSWYVNRHRVARPNG